MRISGKTWLMYVTKQLASAKDQMQEKETSHRGYYFRGQKMI